MRVNKNNRQWIPAVCFAAVFAPSLLVPLAARAQLPRPIERTGRVHGFGWGDGYHVCSESKLRLGADLPPRSYTAGDRISSLAQTPALVHRMGATFYDRFDAAAGRTLVPHSTATARACDAPWIGSADACDRAPRMMIDGSQVIQAERAPVKPQVSASVAPRATIANPAIAAPSPAGTDMAMPEEQPGTEARTAALAPTPLVASAKKYPIRPEPPAVVRPRSIAIAASTKSPPFDFGLEGMGIPNSIIDETSSRDRTEISASSPVVSNTPTAIDPVHPDEPRSLVLRQPEAGDPVKTQQTAVKDSTGQGAGQEAPLPSYAMIPPPAAPTADKPLPQRLGAKSLGDDPPGPPPSTIVRRPSRLGFGSLKMNPQSPRPVVEIAERAIDSDQNVIYQPGLRR